MIKQIGYAKISFDKREIVKSLKETKGFILDCRIKPWGLVNLNDLKELTNYGWAREFGNPFLDTNNYDEAKFLQFLEKNISEKTLNELQDAEKEYEDVYLMCACKNFDNCHTKVVMKFLQKKGFKVEHQVSIKGNTTLKGFI